MSAATSRDGTAEGTILSARGVVNRFGRQRVHDGVDLDVGRGEIVGIAGGSGSGKSVLLKTLAGLHRPQRGEVKIDGRSVFRLGGGEKASLLGVLFQQGALFSSLSMVENVMLPLREHTALSPADREHVALLKLGLAGLGADAASKLPGQLSGGMVKRAALARALALDPRVLFLDEPTSDLDPVAAAGIDALIAEINRSLGITVVVVTHDLTTLFTVCTRVAVLAGRKLTVGTLASLLRSRDTGVRAFFHNPRADAARKARHGNG